uniref:Uncharacterized protein n=1 Tax=Arundo donax TaxID=35708 RepID=A0A0A9GU50_ARUDO
MFFPYFLTRYSKYLRIPSFLGSLPLILSSNFLIARLSVKIALGDVRFNFEAASKNVWSSNSLVASDCRSMSRIAFPASSSSGSTMNFTSPRLLWTSAT